jgi:hypothetical protein
MLVTGYCLKGGSVGWVGAWWWWLHTFPALRMAVPACFGAWRDCGEKVLTVVWAAVGVLVAGTTLCRENLGFGLQ